jgi:alpha-D-ribose 1-methylphosphonate 5-triphosphate synthase subunit PhnH
MVDELYSSALRIYKDGFAMTNRLLAVGLWTGLAIISGQTVSAQTTMKTESAAVNEARARAILGEGTIRFELPLTSPSVAGERAAAWLLSPASASSGESSVAMREGSRWAALTLPWPKDVHGIPVSEIGWYRIAYRIEANGAPVAHGILAVGAIASNLLALRLTRPEMLVAGKPLSVRVYAGNPITRAPYRGVRLQATLILDAPDTKTKADKSKIAERTTVRTAVSGVSGEAIFNFPIKVEPGQGATLTVVGTLTGSRGIDSGITGVVSAHAQATIKVDLETSDRSTIHIETDKPLHKPGETVHLRALVFGDDGHAAADKAITLTISDPDRKTLLEVPLTTNRFGIAAHDWKTGAQLATGEYEAKFEVDDSDSENYVSTTIRIQRYELPEFAVSVAMDHGYYLDGQTPVAHIHAGYLFGKPVASGSLRIVRAENHHWNSKASKYEEPESVEQSATLDADGDAELHLDVKKDFGDFKDQEYRRFTDIRYRAIVTDVTTGRSEPRNFTVRLTRYPVHIYLRELGGNDREGDYLISASYADGVPVPCKVTLDWMDDESHPTHAATVTTNRYSLAKVHLRYPAWAAKKNQYGYNSGSGIRLTAHDREGRTSIFDDTVNAGLAESIWIRVAHTLLKPSQSIEVTLHGPSGSVIDMEALSEDGIIAHQRVRMHGAEQPFTVPANASFHGLIALRAYSMNNDVEGYHWYESTAYKPVLYPEDRELKMRLTGLHSSYAPVAEVDTGVGLHDAAGSPAPGALGVAVIDTAVEQRAETEAEANEHWYGWSWWNQGSNVGGVTRASLNRTNMSQPVPDDLDLAAEAVLLDESRPGIQIEDSNDDSARDDYEAGMKRSVKPLGEAILAAKPERLPATFEAVQRIGRTAKLDDALLLDPWNTPYKVATKVEGNDEVVSLESAGPDKRFGTDDDFTIELTRRNYFALPGERVTELVRDAVKAGKPLPANEKELKALARAGGLELDKTIDPQGKPYHYEVLVQRRSYTIHVFPHDAVLQDGHYSGEAWRSQPIDYFSSTESRMVAAINDWTNAGKLFPETETEARQMFATAGIDFDALRDPLGYPFQLRMTQVLAYTRVEKVKATGGGLEAKSKSVTHLMHVLQIVRSTGKAAGDDAQEFVAQFLHPLTEQSGNDLKPQAVDAGTFKGNSGAIGGTITDQTGAVIPRAKVTITTSGDILVASGETLENGMYLIADLVPGFYSVEVSARGFNHYLIREVHVSSSTLTTVDVTLSVGAATMTVSVEADAQIVQTNSSVVTENRNFAALAALGLGVSSADRKSKSTGPGGKAMIAEPTFTPRLRHVFEETAYWAPSLETDAGGHASIHFRLPDSLTTWKLHALASTVDGRVASLDQRFKSFQPFFVDLDAPQVLTVGDEITLPVNLRNYTAHSVALSVTVKPADWFSLLTAATLQVNVAANGTTPVSVGLRATKAVEAGPLRITAANAREGDAVEKTVRVHPDGEPRSVTASGLLRSGSTTLTLDLPADAIPGSVHAELLLYPKLGTHILHSMKAVLERPYGCGEQTISSTYPSLLFLELLKAAKSTSPKEAEAQNYLQQGYDRLLGYFGAGGGITYWGRSDDAPDAALTAYGIEFLTEAQPYVKVDQSRIVDAVSWLIAYQQADGSWKPHYGETSADLNLYVAEVLHYALASDALAGNSTKDLRERANKAITRAIEWAANSAAAVHDPYANALRLRLASDTETADRLRAELNQTAEHDHNGAHWTRPGYSPFYGWGRAGELETAALVLSALNSPSDQALRDEALYYLLRSQDHYGIWYSGQATVRVLQALLPLAIEETKTNGNTQEFRLAVNGVAITGTDAEALRTDPKLIDAPRSLDLTALLKPGHNELIFSNAGDVTLASAEASASYYVPWVETATPNQTNTQTGKDYGLDFGYSCAAEHATAGRPIDCAVSVRRFGSSSYGMLLAEVGLPPGADVDRASLAKLLDTWTISRYELEPDRIVFYLWSWRAEGSRFSFRFTPRYAIHAKAAPATLFDYYNPDLKAVLAPQRFQVTDSLRR